MEEKVSRWLIRLKGRAGQSQIIVISWAVLPFGAEIVSLVHFQECFCKSESAERGVAARRAGDVCVWKYQIRIQEDGPLRTYHEQ